MCVQEAQGAEYDLMKRGSQMMQPPTVPVHAVRSLEDVTGPARLHLSCDVNSILNLYCCVAGGIVSLVKQLVSEE
jgi:hypothetical protein